MPSAMVKEVSLDTARMLAVIKQGLHQRPPSSDKQTLLNCIRQMGLLQLDTVNVVARSHYLVMLSRVGLYNRADLDALLYPDRQLFEQWAHAMCLIPAEDFAVFAPLIHARREHPLHPHRIKRLGDKPHETLDEVLAEVKERGALASRDFEDPREQRGTWWDWKPAKTALETLFTRGYLMVDRRVNFQIYYDLAERVQAQAAESPSKTVEDWDRWATLKSVTHLGIATAEHAADYYRQTTPQVRTILNELVQAGSVVPVKLQDQPKPAYVAQTNLPLLEEIEAGQYACNLTTFLSPFDNLTWNRDRLLELFGFYYRVEMYTPKAKRKYGYYVLPILHNGRMVGRIDPKADRANKQLIIRAIYLEPGQPVTDDLSAGISGALREFMAFHGSQTLTIEHTEPKPLKQAILARI